MPRINDILVDDIYANSKVFGLDCREILKMRKSSWIMVAVMVVAVSAPNAHADSVYAITFNGTGAPTVVGSNLLDFDTTTKEFTTPTLEIMFDGVDITLDLQFAPGVSPTDALFWAGPFSGGNFDVIDVPLDTPIYRGFLSASEPFGNDTATLTPFVVTPEPSSVALMLLGVGLVFMMRKRIGQGLPQAN
jgi:PEP-CTERM motif